MLKEMSSNLIVFEYNKSSSNSESQNNGPCNSWSSCVFVAKLFKKDTKKPRQSPEIGC